MTRSDETPEHRYNAQLANEIEQRWQDRWDDERVFWTPNRTGLLAEDPRGVAERPSMFILDMFPYPSGVGLHVGHPLGFIGTDVYARFQRMQGLNVLHAMGFDAFGLPAEQFAVQTGQHPSVTTEQNIATMRRQLRALGLAHDPRRGPSTADESYYRWTQWIFLKIYNSWYDSDADRARPVEELVEEFRSGARLTPQGLPFDDLGGTEQRELIDSYRLAFVDESPVNWCPGLGTVLANEEVTPDGRSERGNFPVYKRPLKQWMLGITAYADRLIADLDIVDWPDSIRNMQRNWIGRSTGAYIRFPVEGHEDLEIEVFTTRPDTVFGATYMVLAPEHPLVERDHCQRVARRRDLRRLGEQPDRQLEGRVRHGRPARRGGAPLPRVRRRQVRSRTRDRRPRQERRVPRHLCDQSGQRRAHPDLRRRLRAHGLRHRRDHGRARPRRTRLGVRRDVRPADRAHGATTRRLGG